MLFFTFMRNSIRKSQKMLKKKSQNVSDSDHGLYGLTKFVKIITSHPVYKLKLIKQ